MATQPDTCHTGPREPAHQTVSQTELSISALSSSYLLPCWSLTLGTSGTVVFRVTGRLLRLSSLLFLLFPDKKKMYCSHGVVEPGKTYFNLFFSLSSTELSEICCFFLILSFLLSSLAASSSASSCSNLGYFFSRLSGVACREEVQ